MTPPGLSPAFYTSQHAVRPPLPPRPPSLPNKQVSGKSLMDALQEGAGGNGKPFKVLLPVVTEEGGGDGDGGDDDDHELYPLVGFIRVEFVEPQELVFKAAVGGYHRMKPSGTAAPVVGRGHQLQPSPEHKNPQRRSPPPPHTTHTER